MSWHPTIQLDTGTVRYCPYDPGLPNWPWTTYLELEVSKGRAVSSSSSSLSADAAAGAGSSHSQYVKDFQCFFAHYF